MVFTFVVDSMVGGFNEYIRASVRKLNCDQICENHPKGHIHIILFYCIIVM